MTHRRRLPNRRRSEIFVVEALGLHFTASVSHYDDKQLAEIFLTNHRAGSGAGIMANDAAIAASLALQFGCPPETLRRALSRDAHGDATGPLGVALDLICGSSQ
jgi:hypothetical protein